MNDSANVSSIDALRELRVAFVQFDAEAKEAIVMLTLESRKAIQWLVYDRARYWPDQLRKAQEKVVHARNDLERCQLRYGSEQAPSCFDQKKALEKAKRRMKLCEEKVKIVKKWTIVIRQELEEFDGELTRMNDWLEADLPRGIALLERMVRALDKYAGDFGALSSATIPKASPISDNSDAQSADSDGESNN
jgi:hypothetical protein